MSSATIADQIKNKQLMAAAESAAHDGSQAGDDDKRNLGGASKMDLNKPSMMSVGEDKDDLDESKDEVDDAQPLSTF